MAENLEIKNEPSRGWPVSASLGSLEFVFSGTFDAPRLRKKQLLEALKILEKIILLAVLLGGAASLVWELFNGPSAAGPFLLFAKNRLNFIFWLAVLCGLYLWARAKQENIEQKRMNVLSLPQQAPPAKPLDVYQLFNHQARKLWDKCALLARAQNKPEPMATDLFISLLGDNYAKLAFARANVSSTELAGAVKKLAAENPGQDMPLQKIPFAALSEAIKLHNKTIDPLMLLCALSQELPESHIVQKLLFGLNLDLEKLEILSSWIFTMQIWSDDLKLFHKMSALKPDDEMNRGLTAIPTPYLDRFSTDLTRAAKYGQLPLAWGRAADLQILFNQLREGRQAVVITGAEGTGRTTLINELAYKMSAEQVPNALQDKRLVRLDIAGILSTAGKSETVLMSALNEAVKSGNVVIVLEDIHQLIKTQSEQGLSLIEVLINFLQNSGLQVFATTSLEYFTDLQQVQNFTQIFSSFELPPLQRRDILLACCARASILEYQNKCFFRYQAIDAAVTLSDEYESQTAGQPQRAIAILVEAAARIRHQNEPRVVEEKLIQDIVSEKTHIPAETLSQNESDKLLNLEGVLQSAVVGQNTAVTAVAEALRRARSGLLTGSRPLASFLFLGPTGVGKTELAKQLAKSYFGEEKYLLRLDMSEYRGPDGLGKLLGLPGQNTDTALVKHLKTYPFCLLLCDEFEKAGSEVHNLFLQILDDGRLTTAGGETLNMTQTMVIATSNVGSREIQDGLRQQKNMESIKDELFNGTLTGVFPPELLNRFDGVILFAALAPQDIEQISRLQLDGLKKNLLEKGIKISFGDALIADIAKNGFDPLYGARPIRRYIQDHVEGFIAKLLLSKELSRGSEVLVNIKDGKMVVG